MAYAEKGGTTRALLVWSGVTPLPWGRTNCLREYAAEVALIRKATRDGDFREGSRCRSHQMLGAFDTTLHQPSVRWHSRTVGERSRKMADGQGTSVSNLRQGYLSIEASVNRVGGNSQLPGSQTAAA